MLEVNRQWEKKATHEWREDCGAQNTPDRDNEEATQKSKQRYLYGSPVSQSNSSASSSNAKVCQRHHFQLTTFHSNYTSGLPLAEGCSWPLQSQKKRIPSDNEPLLLLPRGPQADINNNSEHSQHFEDSVCQAWYPRDPPQKWQQLSVQLQELARFANRHYFYSHNYQSSLSCQLWTDVLRLQGSNCSLISMKYYPAQEPVTARNRSDI